MKCKNNYIKEQSEFTKQKKDVANIVNLDRLKE